MSKLVGRTCAICREPLRADYEGRICHDCGQLCHYGCSDLADRGNDACLTCGAPPAGVTQKAGNAEAQSGVLAPGTTLRGPDRDGHKVPSVASVVFSDYASGLCAFTPLVLWAFFGLMSIPGPSDRATVLLCFATAATVFCVPIVCWRTGRIRRLFQVGIPVPGRVVRAWRGGKWRGNLDYTYEYQSIDYRGRAAFMPSARTDALVPGRQVTVLVDPGSPARSVLPAIYYD
jgi:hypothetical protein